MALRIAENQARAREADGIEIVLDVLKTLIENEDACIRVSGTFFSLIQNNCK